MQVQPMREWDNPNKLSRNLVQEIDNSKSGQIFALLYSEAATALRAFQDQPNLQQSKKSRAEHYYIVLVAEYLNDVITNNPALDTLIRYMPTLPTSIDPNNWLEYQHESWYYDDISIFLDRISTIKKPYKTKRVMEYWSNVQSLHESLGLSAVIKHPERFRKETTGKLIIWKVSKRVDYYPEVGAKKTANFNKGERYKLFLMIAKSKGKTLSKVEIMKRMGWIDNLSTTDKLGAALSYIRQSFSLNTRELILVNNGEVRYIGTTEFQE